jgi:hypothetical protein
MTDKPLMWIAYDPSVMDHLKNREQPERDDDGNRVTGYYWTIVVR